MIKQQEDGYQVPFIRSSQSSFFLLSISSVVMFMAKGYIVSLPTLLSADPFSLLLCSGSFFSSCFFFCVF